MSRMDTPIVCLTLYLPLFLVLANSKKGIENVFYAKTKKLLERSDLETEKTTLLRSTQVSSKST